MKVRILTPNVSSFFRDLLYQFFIPASKVYMPYTISTLVKYLVILLLGRGFKG